MRRVLSVLAVVAAVGLTSVGCQTTTGKTAGENVSDASISTMVQSKLTADRMSNFTRVDVDTERGVVNLSGVVASAEQKARAAEVARQVNGVKRVNNNLQIQSMSQ
ncbi:MAG: BON domain-containing protein [Nitrospiraceae bacterium]